MKEPFISVLISEEKLNERIAQLGEQISKDYEGKEVKLICILDRKSTRLNSSHYQQSRMPSSA